MGPARIRGAFHLRLHPDSSNLSLGFLDFAQQARHQLPELCGHRLIVRQYDEYACPEIAHAACVCKLRRCGFAENPLYP